MHLIGRKVNLQAVIFKRVKFDKKSFWTFSFDFFVQFGEFVQLDVAYHVSHETDAKHANICLVVDCFRGEIHQSRETRPPKRPQPEARRPLAQSRPPTAPQKKLRPSQTQSVITLCLPNHTSCTDPVTTSLKSSIALSGSLLAAWGFGMAPAHPRRSKSDSLRPMLVKRVCRWPRRSGDEALRRSPPWLPTGVS